MILEKEPSCTDGEREKETGRDREMERRKHKRKDFIQRKYLGLSYLKN